MRVNLLTPRFDHNTFINKRIALDFFGIVDDKLACVYEWKIRVVRSTTRTKRVFENVLFLQTSVIT